MNILTIIFRSTAVYLFIIMAIRFFGKTELAQLSVVDLVFILLISNSVQNAMVGPDNSLAGGIVAALSLFAINYIFKYIFFRSKRLSRFFQGSPLMLIYKGKVIKSHLKKAKITKDDLKAAIREHGVGRISDVHLAVMEVDGNISVLSETYRRKRFRRRKGHKIISKTI